MTNQELEDLYLRSLDETLSDADEKLLAGELQTYPDRVLALAKYNAARALLRAKEPAGFGPYFAARIINRIQDRGITIDRQIFGLFKKFQLAAVGFIVALLILNIVFSENASVKSAVGLENTAPADDEVDPPFNFTEVLNNL